MRTVLPISVWRVTSQLIKKLNSNSVSLSIIYTFPPVANPVAGVRRACEGSLPHDGYCYLSQLPFIMWGF